MLFDKNFLFDLKNWVNHFNKLKFEFSFEEFESIRRNLIKWLSKLQRLFPMMEKNLEVMKVCGLDE